MCGLTTLHCGNTIIFYMCWQFHRSYTTTGGQQWLQGWISHEHQALLRNIKERSQDSFNHPNNRQLHLAAIGIVATMAIALVRADASFNYFALFFVLPSSNFKSTKYVTQVQTWITTRIELDHLSKFPPPWQISILCEYFELSISIECTSAFTSKSSPISTLPSNKGGPAVKSCPIELLSLGALKYLGRKCTFDDLEESMFI